MRTRTSLLWTIRIALILLAQREWFCAEAFGVDTRAVAELDRLVLKPHVGPVAALCPDEDFLRRVYLDLWGVIPSAEEAAAFLADTRPEKRTELIARLLRGPQFDRHMSYTLDTWLLERRPDKGVGRDEWREYLTASLAADKPYDQLVREILVADGTVPESRPRAKFLLDHDCDPSGLVRDIGRIFLGRDLQCAQCHDHPSVDDYHQEDYQNLLQILQPTYLFTDVPHNSTLYVGERAAGPVEFHSVFIKDDPQHLAQATVPGAPPIPPPLIDPDREYVVPPSDTARAIPRHSARQDLADQLTRDNRDFDLALANRLWKMMFGQGIVDPVDMHHSDNPPSHRELLEELAKQVRRQAYQLGPCLELIANTRAYQRGLDPPKLSAVLEFRDQAEIVVERATETRDALSGKLAAAAEGLKAADAARRESLGKLQEVMRAYFAARGDVMLKQGELDKARGELEPLRKQLADDQAKLSPLSEAADKAKLAAEALPDDPPVKAAAEGLAARLAERRAALTELEKQVQQRQAAETQLLDALTANREKLASNKALVEAEFPNYRLRWDAWQTALHEHWTWKTDRAAAERQIAHAELLIQMADTPVDTSTNDEAAASVPSSALPIPEDVARNMASDFTLARLRHLSPEQLAWSASQATGQLRLEDQAALAEWETKHPSPDNLEPSAKAEREAQRDRDVRRALIARLTGSVNQFAQLFGGMSGQPQTEFHAAADQALFLSNSGQIQGMLQPAGGNLTERLGQQTDIQRLVDELYLSVLSRVPSPSERTIGQEYMVQNDGQRGQAIQELVWSLLTSPEFRFYR